MQPDQSTSKPALPPLITCEPLPPFDHADLKSVRRAFRSATPCLFEQAWLDKEAADFLPGVVRTGWRGDSLLVFAELTDSDIFNDATELNQRAWELGDVFEMFLRVGEDESYVEFQVTPNNQRLQLRYPDAQALAQARKTGRIENFLIRTEAFQSLTWIQKENSQWSVYAAIPAAAVCSSQNMENAQWHFSFGRYDYTRGISEPVISSTSPHAQPDFHRQQEWGVMTFKNSPVIQDR
jgi:hypothetical protein